MAHSKCSTDEFDIDKPRYDQDTYSGRAKQFFETINPLNLLASEKELDRANCIVQKLRYSFIYSIKIEQFLHIFLLTVGVKKRFQYA